jgi:hypothetical protein
MRVPIARCRVCGQDDPSPDRPELLSAMAAFKQVWITGARRFTMMEAPKTLMRRWTLFSQGFRRKFNAGRCESGGIRPPSLMS